MQEWSATCPSCRRAYPLAFSQRATAPTGTDPQTMPRAGVVWDATAKRDDATWDIARAVESVRFRCPHCAHEMPDADTTREHWKKSGHYVAALPDAPAGVKSFRVEALVSRPLALLAQEFCEAENHATRHGDNGARIEFRTKREARPWIVEKRTVNVFVGESGYKVADYADGRPIEHEVARFMTIDRQQTHWWVEVGAWSTATGPRYRQLWFGRVDTRDQLREVQRRSRVPDYCVAQDRGFHEPGPWNTMTPPTVASAGGRAAVNWSAT